MLLWLRCRATAFVIFTGGMILASCAAADETDPPASATAALDAFIAVEEPEFAWRLSGQRQVGGTKVFHLELTSQRWQNLLWQHALMVYEPAEVKYGDHMLMLVTGGSSGKAPGDSDVVMGIALAKACGSRVAVLHHVPNQPLMDGRVEDDLITETWLRYLASGDSSWPLLFPMVKSAVKAMDALEQFSAAQQWPQLKGFVISGASKRGWTSWLAAAADRRVKATAPMVIDMLNFPAQMKHQHALWGKPSEQVSDYTSKGLISPDGVPRPGRETTLWQMMDPYSYRQHLAMPKLLIVGASDRYWSTDAMNLYWDDLLGEKYIFRAANAGHGLEGSRDEAVSTLGVFFRHVASNQRLPELSWSVRSDDEALGLVVQSDRQPVAARLWTAHSPSTDFRDARWQSRPLRQVDGRWAGEQPLTQGQHVAVFAELQYEFEGLTYSLATLAYLR